MRHLPLHYPPPVLCHVWRRNMRLTAAEPQLTVNRRKYTTVGTVSLALSLSTSPSHSASASASVCGKVVATLSPTDRKLELTPGDNPLRQAINAVRGRWILPPTPPSTHTYAMIDMLGEWWMMSDGMPRIIYSQIKSILYALLHSWIAQKKKTLTLQLIPCFIYESFKAQKLLAIMSLLPP